MSKTHKPKSPAPAEDEDMIRIAFKLNTRIHPQLGYFKELNSRGRGACNGELVRLALIGLRAEAEEQELLRAARRANLAGLIRRPEPAGQERKNEPDLSFGTVFTAVPPGEQEQRAEKVPADEAEISVLAPHGEMDEPEQMADPAEAVAENEMPLAADASPVPASAANTQAAQALQAMLA